jgi:hypothetical protein
MIQKTKQATFTPRDIAVGYYSNQLPTKNKKREMRTTQPTIN